MLINALKNIFFIKTNKKLMKKILINIILLQLKTLYLNIISIILIIHPPFNLLKYYNYFLCWKPQKIDIKNIKKPNYDLNKNLLS